MIFYIQDYNYSNQTTFKMNKKQRSKANKQKKATRPPIERLNSGHHWRGVDTSETRQQQHKRKVASGMERNTSGKQSNVIIEVEV